jgi:hypothetical protein|tara:strand:- start:1463 stop:1585 length:123 start_codon:yes stop_codon:yes gene_type:complete
MSKPIVKGKAQKDKYCKHLKKYGKRLAAKAERKNAKNIKY